MRKSSMLNRKAERKGAGVRSLFPYERSHDAFDKSLRATGEACDRADDVPLILKPGLPQVVELIKTECSNLAPRGSALLTQTLIATRPVRGGVLRGKVLSGLVSQKVTTDRDLFTVSWSLGVRPSTIRKMLNGRPVSRALERKIDTAIQRGALSQAAESPSPEEARLLETFALYRREGTLEATGKRLGLTRERVRQLLVKGSKLGFFEYKSVRRFHPVFTKAKILYDYRRFLQLKLVAGNNGVSTDYLNSLLVRHGIRPGDLRKIRVEERKSQCIREYGRLAVELGHLPTTPELQRHSGAYLSHKIRALWGSFPVFRERFHHLMRRDGGTPQAGIPILKTAV